MVVIWPFPQKLTVLWMVLSLSLLKYVILIQTSSFFTQNGLQICNRTENNHNSQEKCHWIAASSTKISFSCQLYPSSQLSVTFFSILQMRFLNVDGKCEKSTHYLLFKRGSKILCIPKEQKSPLNIAIIKRFSAVYHKKVRTDHTNSSNGNCMKLY